MTTRALVIGLGQIGMGYDLRLDPAYVLTHARAFQQHPAFELVGGVDPDALRRREFAEHYGVAVFADVASAMHAVRPDLVAIATPTAMHAETVRTVLESGSPAALLCEKPLSFDLNEARAILASCRECGCRLYVNYIRRSEPGAAEVRKRLIEGAIALPVKGVAWYSKGLLNNGSHFLNLLQYWLGEVRATRLLAAGRMWSGVDPEPDFSVSFAQGEVYFLAAREEHFSLYTIELIAPNGRLRYEQGGERILWQHAAADPAYSGYTVLAPQAESICTDYARTQWHVADQIAASLSSSEARICSGDEALRTIETITAIRTGI